MRYNKTFLLRGAGMALALSFDILRKSAGEHPCPAGRQHTAGPASRRGGGISCGSHPSPRG